LFPELKKMLAGKKYKTRAALIRSTFYNWVSQFREGRTSVFDRRRTGRPAEAVTPTMVANVKAFVKKNRRVTLEEVANKFSIGKAHKILHEHVGMSKVSARWVPRQLSADQTATGVTNAKEHLRRFNREGNKFLNRIITGDEMWVHYSEPETKAQYELVPHLLKSLSCLLRLAKSCLLPFGIHEE
jgi:histone-lysine N-methyltransferase SETMAR